MTNYDQLKIAIEEWTHRSDLTTRIPDFIRMAESTLNRALRLKSMEVKADLTLNVGDSFIALPAGFMEAISLTNDLGDGLVPLTPVQLADHQAQPGRPHYYRVSTRIDFERAPDAAYVYQFRHYKRLDLQTDVTNEVLTYHPDLYLYAALMHAEPYMSNDARVGTWASMLDKAISDANYRDSRNLATLKTDIINTGYYDISRG
jgi:hypothetical protein